MYLRGGLCQTHDGLPLRCGGHCAHLQVVWLQLRDRGEERRAGQRGSREMGRWSVHLFVTPEIQSDLFADGGGPGPPLVLNGCEAGQQRHRAGSETMISAGVCMSYLSLFRLSPPPETIIARLFSLLNLTITIPKIKDCEKEMKNDWL